MAANNSSAKNRLQEYCQKSSLDLPRYESWWDNISSGWKSMVCINLGNGKICSYDCLGTYSRKVDAEQSAANCVMDYLSSVRPDRKVLDQSVLILVDIENKQKIVHKILNDYSNLQILAVGNNNDLLVTHAKMEGCEVYPVKSDRRDAADVAICYLIGVLTTAYDYDKVIVVTGDHFGSALSDIVDMVILCKDFEDIEKVLG